MKKCYLDSNVLIYFKDESSPYFTKSKNLLIKLAGQNVSLFVSPLCLDEFLHALNQSLGQSQKTSSHYSSLKKALHSILDLPLLTIINPPTAAVAQTKVLSFMEKFALRPRDAYHLLTMKTYHIDGFATFDRDFEKVFAAHFLERA